MIREYIEKQLEEINDELMFLDSQMNQLMNDYQKQNHKFEELQKYKNRDENIFSPRSAMIGEKEDLSIEKSKLEAIKIEIERVREKIEKAILKREEYETVLRNAESEKIDGEKRQEDEEIDVSEQDSCEAVFNDSLISVTDNLETEMEETKKEMASAIVNAVANTVDVDFIKCEQIDKKAVIEFLQGISRELDLSLAFLNGDKNKCKNQLRKAKVDIKNFLDKIEKGKNE